jgi:anti-anti-sigma factor
MAASVQSDLPDVIAGRLGILVSVRGATTTIALRGEWDLAHQQATRQAIRRALASQPDRLVPDLSRLSFIDSSGVHPTVDLARRSARLNIRLVIVHGPRPVQRIFEICHLTEVLPFTTTGRR